MDENAAPGNGAVRGVDKLELVCEAGPVQGSTFRAAVGRRKLPIGRTKASFVFIKDPSVSERHGAIEWDEAGGCWTLADLGSSNGTALNGAEVRAGGPAVPLREGDVIELGPDTRLVVKLQPVAAHGDDMTVEQFLLAECDRLVKEVQVAGEAAVAQLEQLGRVE